MKIAVCVKHIPDPESPLLTKARFPIIEGGDIPSPLELARALEENLEKPLPAWFLKLVCAELRGELKRKPGRKAQSQWREIFIDLAEWDYRRHLHWLKARRKSQGLRGWTCVRGKKWWTGPPHERALAIVYELYSRTKSAGINTIGFRRFRNLISSRQ